jgi:RimJ/RimL family protein N-acetyltransferase
MFKVYTLDPENFSSLQWEEYFALRMSLGKRYNDPAIFDNINDYKKSCLESIQDNMAIGVMESDGRMIGYFRYQVRSGHPNLLFVFVREEDASDDLLRKMCFVLDGIMMKKGHTSVLWRSRYALTNSWQEKVGGRLSNTGVHFRLNLADLDPVLMEKWSLRDDLVKEGFKTELSHHLSDEQIDAVLPLVAESLLDMIREDNSVQARATPEELKQGQRKMKERGHDARHIILFAPDGEVVGITALIFPFKEGEADQRITAVERKFRGKGLAKWLKALMITETKRSFPGINAIRTECYALNKPMIDLNLAMGFKETAKDRDYEMKPEDWARLF